jgi:ParB family chromosome partitioning protein
MGKNAFDVSKSSVYNFPPEELIIIGWDTEDGQEHPLWDERAKLPVDEKLVLNIMAIGKIINPISIRKNGDKAEVVVGRQRVKACREANKRLKKEGSEPVNVPAQLERTDENRAMGFMISENELRRDDTPLTRAKKVQRYIDRGNSIEDAAKIFGVTSNAIKMYQKVLDLEKGVQKLVEDGKMSATAAASLSDLPRDEQKEQAEKMISEGKATIGDVKTAVKKRKSRGLLGEDENIVKAPGKKQLKRLLKRNDELVEEERLDPMFIKGVRFAMGDIGPSVIKGLKGMMADEWK